MLRLARLAIILMTTALIYGLWLIYPAVLGVGGAGSLMFVFVLAFGFAQRGLYKGQKLIELDGLSTIECNRLRMVLRDVRRRIWEVIIMAVVSSVVVIAVSWVPFVRETWNGAVVLGLLVGLNLSNLLVLRHWHEEMFQFSDKIHCRHRAKQQTSESLKRISDGRVHT